MKTRKNDITMRIPGGWYGNDPGTWDHDPTGKVGNVVVDPSKAVFALDWLRKRAHLDSLNVVDEVKGHGILINYTMK